MTSKQNNMLNDHIFNFFNDYKNVIKKPNDDGNHHRKQKHQYNYC
jgi:hypothetical protein